jgi:hypothetical protein
MAASVSAPVSRTAMAAPVATASVAATMPAAAVTATAMAAATTGKLYAVARYVFLVEDKECAQADVRQFLLSEDYRCRGLCRYIGSWSNRSRCAAR